MHQDTRHDGSDTRCPSVLSLCVNLSSIYFPSFAPLTLTYVQSVTISWSLDMQTGSNALTPMRLWRFSLVQVILKYKGSVQATGLVPAILEMFWQRLQRR